MLKVCRRLTPVAAVVLAMASPSAQRDDTHGRDAVPDHEDIGRRGLVDMAAGGQDDRLVEAVHLGL